MKIFKDILKTFSFGILAGFAIGLGGFASLFLKHDTSAISTILQAFIFTIGQNAQKVDFLRGKNNGKFVAFV